MTALRTALATLLVATSLVLPACTDGKTPDCSDAQCATEPPPPLGGPDAASSADVATE